MLRSWSWTWCEGKVVAVMRGRRWLRCSTRALATRQRDHSFASPTPRRSEMARDLARVSAIDGMMWLGLVHCRRSFLHTRIKNEAFGMRLKRAFFEDDGGGGGDEG